MTPRVVIVIGALSGIGRATAKLFAKQGDHVVVAGRSSMDGNTLAEELCAFGSQAEFMRADVRYDAEVCDLVRKTVERFGRLDVLVNAAATEGSVGPLIEKTTEDFAGTFDTNVLGTFLSTKYALLSMLPQNYGSIVNLSSTLGQRTAVGASLYSASKHAVEGLTKTAALEAAAFNVRVNAIAPGPVDTAMLTRFSGTDDRKAALVQGVPLKRMGTPEEIARVIVFVCSDQASFVTGQIIGVDGGKMA